jgi:type 1 glutamine amidotransferase
MLWTVNYGKGRVFVTAMGHDTEAMKNAGFAVTLARGTEWAASEKVTIPVPPELK